MARRSTIEELRGRNELSCMWGLFSVLESCDGRPHRKLISNGRRVNREIIDYPRKLDELASFDEECRKIQNEVGLRSVAADVRAKSVGNFIQEMPIDEHKHKEIVIKRRERSKMDSELDRRLKNEKTTQKSSENADHSCSCCMNSETSLDHHLHPTSSESSLNKLTLAAILDAVCGQNHLEKSKLSENFHRSSYLGKYDLVNEINIQKVQMRAKALVDQMYIDRKFICKEGMISRSESFSSALEVLNSNKDLTLNLHPSTFKSVLDASSSAEPRSVSARKKGNTNMNSRQKSDKIVILKPAPRNLKQSENVLCHCSSLRSHNKSGRRVSDVKTSSFSFREMKRKLKHTFGGTSDKPSQDSSTMRVGNECISGGVEVRNSFDEQKGKLGKNHYLESNRGSDIACLNDPSLKKLDFSSVGFSNKQDFDVILEAKRHLSARLNNVNSVEAVTSHRSPKTLGRILSSPEHDFLLRSPRRHSQYSSGSTQMRFSPFNTPPRVNDSEMPNVRESAGLSPLRSNTEFKKNHGTLQLIDEKISTLIPRTEEGALDSNISTTCGELKNLEMSSTFQPDTCNSEEVPNEINDSEIQSSNDDEIAMHSILDSLSEAEAISSTVEDFPSTPSSIYQLDTSNCIKYQEERQSPVSVLEPFFIEDADSPPSITLQTAKKHLQPRCLHFEDCSFESTTQDPSIAANSCTEEEGEEEEDHISQYVQLILQSSGLNWDQLSQIKSPPEELLHASLFDEVEFPFIDCYYDPKLLFDHINEVLLEIYKSHFCSPTRPALSNPKTGSVSLEEHVLDEILREAEFYLLPTTERRTLDQLVSEDVVKCRSWLDVRLDTEQVVIEISEDVLEEYVLEIVLEFCT